MYFSGGSLEVIQLYGLKRIISQKGRGKSDSADLPNSLSTAFAVGADQPRSWGHPAGCGAPACALAAAQSAHTAARIREEGGQCHLQSHYYQLYYSEPF